MASLSEFWFDIVDSRPAWMTDAVSFYVGTTLGVVGVVAGLWTYWLGRQSCHLSYEVKTTKSILSDGTRDGMESLRLRVLWTDSQGAERELEEPELHTIKIWNSGRSGVGAADLLRKLLIKVPSGIDSLQASVSTISHSDIAAIGPIPILRSPGDTSIEVPLVGLSARDWLEVELLTDKRPSPPVTKAEKAVERFYRERTEAGLSTAQRLQVDCWIKNQTRVMRRADADLDTLVWKAMPKLTTRGVSWTAGIIYGILVIVVSIFTKEPVLDVIWQIPFFVLVILLALCIQGLIMMAIVLPIYAFLRLMRRVGIRLLTTLSERTKAS